MILGPTRIWIFNTAGNSAKNKKISTKLEFLIFALYGRNPALKFLGYLMPTVCSTSCPTHLWQHFSGLHSDKFLYWMTRSQKIGHLQLLKTIKWKMTCLLVLRSPVLSNFWNFRAGFMPYKAKNKDSNLVLSLKNPNSSRPQKKSNLVKCYWCIFRLLA